MSVISLSVILCLNKLELIYSHINIAIVSIGLDDFIFCSLSLIILFSINHLFTDWSTYKYCYLTQIIVFNTIHSFAPSQMFSSIVFLTPIIQFKLTIKAMYY